MKPNGTREGTSTPPTCQYSERHTKASVVKSTRVQTLYPKYRARNWLETLDEKEQKQWQAFCQARIIDGEYDCALTAEQFQKRLED